MRVEFSSIIVFTGLISIAVGIILATTLSTIDRSARYWIAGALLSGVAALMRTVTPQGDHLIGVSIPNAVNFLINLMFALSLRALTRNASSHRRLLVGGIVFAVLYAVLHEIFAGLGLALVEVIINPILQITMASVIGYYAMKLYKERGFRFAAVLAVLQVMLALLWIARGVTGLSQGRIDFAALSVVNAFIFTPLMLVGTVRLLCYLGLRLEEFVAKVDRSGADGLLNTLNALALSRDNETGNHVLRTQKYVRLLAEHLLARGKLDTQGIRDYPQLLHDVAPLHDIGKVGIPDRILKKPGSLDKAEWEIMRTHTTVGAEVIDAARTPQMATDSYVNDVLHLARQIALSHHENWDGSGYPQGLAGKQIPQAAQLMAIADAYDALRSERVYKKAWAHDSAVDDIVALSGKRFDPELVDAFVDEAERLREIAEAYHD
jgi:HD-GYP domain-containing protein (c-di-GMP phosphodiesterase class II)